MKCRRQKPATGFTLVEMLVAMSVLVLMVTIVSQIISLAGSGTNHALTVADADGQARMTLDRLAFDWQNRVRTTDLGVNFGKQAGNDSLTYYSSVQGFGGVRKVTEVGYYVLSPATGSPSLQRGVTGSDWDGSNGNALQFWPSPMPTVSPGNYQTLAGNIFRFEICFQMKDTGALVATPPTDISKAAAVVITVALLDKDSQAKMGSYRLDNLASLLPDAADGSTPLEQWNSVIQSHPSGVPPIVLRNVRLYQRMLPCSWRSLGVD